MPKSTSPNKKSKDNPKVTNAHTLGQPPEGQHPEINDHYPTDTDSVGGGIVDTEDLSEETTEKVREAEQTLEDAKQEVLDEQHNNDERGRHANEAREKREAEKED